MIPALALCTVQNTFTTPVMAADGITYERDGFQAWLAVSDLRPATSLPLAHKRLELNYTVLQRIKALELQMTGALAGFEFKGLV